MDAIARRLAHCGYDPVPVAGNCPALQLLDSSRLLLRSDGRSSLLRCFHRESVTSMRGLMFHVPDHGFLSTTSLNDSSAEERETTLVFGTLPENHAAHLRSEE